MPAIYRHADLAAEILRRAPRCGAVRVVAIDGTAGSGKTTFADRLAVALGQAPVVHTDDLASHDHLFDWWPSLVESVFRPLQAGLPGRYRVYDWPAHRFGPSRDVPPAPVLIVEGVGSGRRELAPWLCYLIWVQSDPELAGSRGLGRDIQTLGDEWRDELTGFWARWIEAERAHFAADPTVNRADLVIDARSGSVIGHDTP